MPGRAEYHPEAVSEIRHAASWYDEQVKDLGLDFLLEVRSAEFRILEHPEAWPDYEAGTKRCIMQKFPFAVVYQVSKEAIQIVAVAHCKRKPGYWKDRIS